MKYLQTIGEYEYFRRVVGGRTIRHRMPSRDDPAFLPTYKRLCAGKSPDGPVPGSMAELVALYRQHPGIPEQRIKAYRSLAPSTRITRDFYLNLIEREHGNKGYTYLTRGSVKTLRNKLAATPGKANVLLAVLSVLFEVAIDLEKVKVNPCIGVGRLEIGEHRPWTDKEIDKAFEVATPLTRLALALLLYTGQRVGDVVKMEWKHVKDGVIEVVQQKTSTRVWIPVHPKLKVEIDRVPRHVRWLLYNIHGKQMQIPALEDRMTVLRRRLRALDENLGTKMRWHGLRKNVVNNLLELGCSTAEVASITGQTLQTIEHYAKGRDGKTLAKSAMAKWENG